LGLVAANDRESKDVQEFLKSGREAIGELNTALATSRKTGREAAVESLRGGVGIRAMDKARDSAMKIMVADGTGADGLRFLLTTAGLTFRRLAQAIGALGFIGVLVSVLLFREARRTS
jgi:hypothetical protein